MMIKKKTVLTFVIILLTIAAVYAISTFRDFDKTIIHTEEEKREIIENTIRNNPSALINQRNTHAAALNLHRFSAESLNLETQNNISSTPFTNIPSSILGNKTFKTAKLTRNLGNYSQTCKAFSYLNNSYSDRTIEISEFLKNGNFYSKVIGKNTTGELNYSNLYISAENEIENHEYRGGNFAVKTVIERIDPEIIGAWINEEIIDEVLPVEEEYAHYFGNNVNIMGEQKENNNEYYILEFRNSVNCEDEFPFHLTNLPITSSTIEQNTAITQILVDKNTFLITKISEYLNEVSDSNLIVVNNIEVTAIESDLSEVRSNFIFDINAPVREIREIIDNRVVIDNSTEAQSQEMVNYLSTLDLSLLLLQDENVKASNVYFQGFNESLLGIDKYSQILKDRDFFHSDDKGQDLFDEINVKIDGKTKSLASMSYLYNDKYITIDVFEDSVSREQLLREELGENIEVFNETVNIMIDWAFFSGDYYKYSLKGFESEPIDTAYSFINIHNKLYRIEGLNSAQELSQLQLQTVNTQDANRHDFLRSKIFQSLEIITSDETEEVSE